MEQQARKAKGYVKPCVRKRGALKQISEGNGQIVMTTGVQKV